MGCWHPLHHTDLAPWSAEAVDTLEVRRVHAAENLLSSCSVHTPELPGGRAWISPGGRLTFGLVRHELRLRVRRAGGFQGSGAETPRPRSPLRCQQAVQLPDRPPYEFPVSPEKWMCVPPSERLLPPSERLFFGR